jgi:hypothetical protein
MAEPRVIRNYLATLDARLPTDIVEELADGLKETYRHYLAAGLDQQSAAHAALAEFGDAEEIAAAFTRSAPARRAARALLGAGPVVGGCWAAALIDARAWTWPVPALIPLIIGAGLVVVIALLVTAAFSGRYRTSRRAASIALIGVVLLDVTLPGTLVAPDLLRGWPLLLAAGLSLARAVFAARAWQRQSAR